MIDWCQEVMGFLALPLLLPESGEAGGSAEFPGFCLLALGYCHSLGKTGFCFSLRVRKERQQQLPFEPMQLCFAETLTIFVYQRQGFS